MKNWEELTQEDKRVFKELYCIWHINGKQSYTWRQKGTEEYNYILSILGKRKTYARVRLEVRVFSDNAINKMTLRVYSANKLIERFNIKLEDYKEEFE